MPALFQILKGKLELFIWLFALLALYFMPVGGAHYSLCLYSQLGFTWCPGCGLGHALHHLMHFNFVASWQEHWLGIPTFIMLTFRIFQLLKTPSKP